MQDREREKQLAAEAAVALVEEGMTLGLGSGSTLSRALPLLGRRLADGLAFRGVATSTSTASLAAEAGIPLVDFAEVAELDLAIDGADEVSPELHMIKGGGGALVREKIVAAASRRVAIMVDSSKIVQTLGRFPLPVEVVPFGHELFLARMRTRDVPARLRMLHGAPFVTDNGNLIIDCSFGEIGDAAVLHHELNSWPGVVDTGLFIDLLDVLIVGRGEAVEVTEKD